MFASDEIRLISVCSVCLDEISLIKISYLDGICKRNLSSLFVALWNKLFLLPKYTFLQKTNDDGHRSFGPLMESVFEFGFVSSFSLEVNRCAPDIMVFRSVVKHFSR